VHTPCLPAEVSVLSIQPQGAASTPAPRQRSGKCSTAPLLVGSSVKLV
jgi:hypothetical protein